MPILTEEQLRNIGTSIFRAAGVPENIARHVSNSMVEANLTGHDSHGAMRIP
jgi:uncharacterized oxidoreductase